jgi:hypothetical protein
MLFSTVQLLTEEYSTMSPGELEAKGFMPYTDQPDQGGIHGEVANCTPIESSTNHHIFSFSSFIDRNV